MYLKNLNFIFNPLFCLKFKNKINLNLKIPKFFNLLKSIIIKFFLNN